MAYIESICISLKKGTRKKEISQANFLTNWGIETDAHGGNWHRQVSILSAESFDLVKKKMAKLKKGAFAENLVIRGLDFGNIKIGDYLTVNGEIKLQITQIGKECHKACAIKKITGDCIMPKEGLFARIVNGGIVQKKDKVFHIPNGI